MRLIKLLAYKTAIYTLLSTSVLAYGSNLEPGSDLTSANIGIKSTLSSSNKKALTQVAKKVQFKGLISNKSNLTKPAYSGFEILNDKTLTINKPGASFIKVHFKKLTIPDGQYIQVRNDDGTQIHQYGNNNSSLFTLQEGDDGETSFSALSIIGDTAIIELKGQTGNDLRFHIEVDSIMQGFNELEHLEVEYSSFLSGVQPKSSCGVTERPDVQCWADSHPVEFERSRPVAKLLINGSALCTAWRVGEDNRLFTNNHCVSSASGPSKTEVWFNYQKSGCNSGSTSGTVIVTGDELLSTNSDLDYTLFTVKNFEEIQAFGHFGLDVRNPIDQERIYIPQHGRGQPKQLAIESDENADGLCRVDVTLADGSAPNTDMGYMCDTIGGSSGSPVLAASSNQVLALHHFGGCPNQGVLINLIWPEVASYFGNQIPIGDNGTPTGEPVASFNSSSNVLEVTFTDTSYDSDGSIVSHRWDFGDGSSSVLANPVHIYASAGDYSVTLTVTDNDGNTNSNSQVVSISNDNNGELSKGVAVGNLFASIDEELEFYFDVPTEAASVSFVILGGTGDADLYVSFDEKPTESNYDCRPYKGGNSEECVFRPAEEGRYHVMLKAYRGFSGVELVADYTEKGDTVRIEESNLNDTRYGWKHFSFEVSEGMSELNATISGGTGDADLYIQFGSEPSTSNYRCRPYKNGNEETCIIQNPEQGTWFISIRAYSDYSGVDLIGEAF